MCCGIYPAPGRLCVHHAAGHFSALSDITCRISVSFYPLSAAIFGRFLAASAAAGQILPPFCFRILAFSAAARLAHNAYLKYLKYLRKTACRQPLFFKASKNRLLIVRFTSAHRQVYFCSSSSLPVLRIRSHILCAYHIERCTCIPLICTSKGVPAGFLLLIVKFTLLLIFCSCFGCRCQLRFFLCFPGLFPAFLAFLYPVRVLRVF